VSRGCLNWRRQEEVGRSKKTHRSWEATGEVGRTIASIKRPVPHEENGAWRMGGGPREGQHFLKIVKALERSGGLTEPASAMTRRIQRSGARSKTLR